MVIVNGKEMIWENGMTVLDAIKFTDYVEYNYPILIVHLNDVNVKSKKFDITPINDGDIIEVFQPLDGG